LHVDFHKINLTEKVTANIPIVAIGDAKAVSDKIGSLLTLLSEIEVEALPSNLPEKIEVDISGLSNVEESLKIKDIKIDNTKITLLSDPEQELFRIEPLVSKEAEELAREEKEKAAATSPALEEPQTSTPEDAPKEEEKQAE
jgi:large subunit ribosomal protein L25